MAGPAKGAITRAASSRVGQAAERAQVGGREMRPLGRDVEAAILGEAGEQDAGEVAHGRAAAGGDIAHGGESSRGAVRREAGRSKSSMVARRSPGW